MKRIILTGGGTAGHVNPAVGVAGRIRELLPESDVLVDEILPLIIYRTVNSKMTRSSRLSTASPGCCSSRGFIWHKKWVRLFRQDCAPDFCFLK
mgnify:CR=1 FL=1